MPSRKSKNPAGRAERGGDKELRETSAEQAALCDCLLPVLSRLRDSLWALALKGREEPDQATVRLAAKLLADARVLLRGEPMARYLAGIFIEAEGNGAGLALKLTTIETAVLEFRRRYFGWHAGLGKPGWYLAGPEAAEMARNLVPRADSAPGDAVKDRESTRFRDLLARRIEQLKRA